MIMRASIGYEWCVSFYIQLSLPSPCLWSVEKGTARFTGNPHIIAPSKYDLKLSIPFQSHMQCFCTTPTIPPTQCPTHSLPWHWMQSKQRRTIQPLQAQWALRLRGLHIGSRMLCRERAHVVEWGWGHDEPGQQVRISVPWSHIMQEWVCGKYTYGYMYSGLPCITVFFTKHVENPQVKPLHTVYYRHIITMYSTKNV